MKLDLFDAIAGHYAACCLSALQEAGVLAQLRQPASPATLADRTGLDPELLAGVLDFLAATTEVLARGPAGYQLADAYRSPNALEFHLDKFIGAYGPPIQALDQVLQQPASGAGLVAGAKLARAFAALHQPVPSLTAQLLRGWQIDSLVDLGCGAGGLLVELAGASASFRGWGFDANPEMVRAACRAADAAGVADRVEFRLADVRALEAGAVPDGAKAAAAIHARSLFNALIDRDGSAVVRLICRIRELFGATFLFVEDYYGRLG
ncbi:MAG TPA: class I SAM-dependent methyltransferase, partial [Jatrophihabitans sp.]|nr:class I SAM-dependent methyltransferase [Jatrophihabitans sp.]